MLPRVTYTNVGEDFSPVHDRLDAEFAALARSGLGATHMASIGGEEAGAAEGYDIRSPIDRDILIGRFPRCGEAEVDRSVRAARQATGAWRGLGWEGRVAALRRAADILDGRKYAIAAACILEVGKSRIEAMGEVEEAVDLIRYYADEMERAGGYRIEGARALPEERSWSRLRPYGVFAVIAPFNFPVALALGMSAAALIAGNTIVFKPSEANAWTGRLVADCLLAADLPPGAVNLVTGGAATGRALAQHPGIDGIAFTGSNAVGMELIRRASAGRAVRPVLAEMGGKNPAFVEADADLDAAASGVARSAYGLQGQKCSALSKVYVHRDIRDAFLERLRARIAAIRIGDPRGRDVFMGPVIDARAVSRFEEAVAEARRDGDLLAGGVRLDEGDLARGHFVAPTLVAGLDPDHRINREELFLPFLSLRDYDCLDAAIAEANCDVYGLTAGIYTRSRDALDLFLDRIEAGVLYANRASGATTGAWPGIQTFCGWKGSGATGKGGLGRWYLPQFMREQSVTLYGEPQAA